MKYGMVLQNVVKYLTEEIKKSENVFYKIALVNVRNYIFQEIERLKKGE